MASKKKTAKRGRKHPGVVLIKPDEKKRMGWRARYVNPDSEKSVHEALDRALTTLEQREKWAVNKSKELAKRRLELALGAGRETGTKLGAALNRYFEENIKLRPRTKEIYRNAADKLEDWCKDNRVKSADQLTRGKLTSFRAKLIKEPKRAAVKGGKRGERVSTGEPRSAVAVNQELRAVRTVLEYLRKGELLPKLNSDDLRDSLETMAVTHERIDFLKGGECKQLMEAALKHDAEKFAITRAEHDGKRPVGSTARYAPIAPFTFFMLATGMRLNEALTLEWSQVDLDALDHEGRKVGEIHLSTENTKTKQERTVCLDVSPALRATLSAVPESERNGRVFKLSYGEAQTVVDRLRTSFGAPTFTWQKLRRTCGTFLTCSPGIFGSTSAFMSASQLGHGVQVAQKAYVGKLRGVPREARTLEAAMQLTEVVAKLPGQPTADLTLGQVGVAS